RGDVRDELPAPRRDQEVEVPDLGGEAVVREIGDRLELPEIMRAHGRLDDEREPGPVQDLRSRHRVPPGAAHVPEAIVTIGIERIERERSPRAPASARRLARFSVMLTPLVPTTTQRPRSDARRTISRMSRRKSGSPPV